MKELSSNKLFRPGRDKNIRDYLPLNEPSIQQYMKHEAIVETYWADVRCLDPKTDRPLEIGVKDLEGNAWLSLDHLEDIERTYTEAAGGAAHRRTTSGRVPEAVKLQMRIAMEHCDLSALPHHSRGACARGCAEALAAGSRLWHQAETASAHVSQSKHLGGRSRRIHLTACWRAGRWLLPEGAVAAPRDAAGTEGALTVHVLQLQILQVFDHPCDSATGQ